MGNWVVAQENRGEGFSSPGGHRLGKPGRLVVGAKPDSRLQGAHCALPRRPGVKEDEAPLPPPISTDGALPSLRVFPVVATVNAICG
jgi:hypothetical protein